MPDALGSAGCGGHTRPDPPGRGAGVRGAVVPAPQGRGGAGLGVPPGTGRAHN
jgi:hypothetical protein